jgi:hypothetical protein
MSSSPPRHAAARTGPNIRLALRGPFRIPTGAQRWVAAALAALVTVGLFAVTVSPSEAAGGSFMLRPGSSASAGVEGTRLDTRASTVYTVRDSSAPVYLSVETRSSADAEGYRAKVRVDSNGTLRGYVVRVHNGVETTLASAPVSGTVTSGSQVQVETTVTGTSPVTVSMRAWKVGSTRPAWQVQAVDSSSARITSAGTARAWAYLGSSATASVVVPYVDLVAAAPAAPPAPPAPPSAKPSLDNTGIPAGTHLTQHNGDITITQPGTVIDSMDVHGFITVRAANVVIKNSIIRGGTATGNRGVITNYGFSNLLVQDSEIIPAHPTVWQDGVKGSDFTLRRVYVTGNVDSVKIQGNNVTVESSLLENTTYYSSDPNQGGGPTHNDNIQIQEGSNLRIIGNTIRRATNFAILGSADMGDTPGLLVSGNWLDGGHCTVKIQELNGHQLTGAQVVNNKFGPNRAVQSCPIVAVHGTGVSASGNTLEATGAPVGIFWSDS